MGCIAVINPIGTISGYGAPQMVGLLREATGSHQIPMIAASLFMVAICILGSPSAAAPVLAWTPNRR